MTEKLTYDPTPYDAPEFTEAETEALEAADRLGEEEAALYAGKYENAEELEQAYLELQRKLGSSDGENLDDEDLEQDTLDSTEDEDLEWSDGAQVIADASEEYYANDGQLSPETMQQFSEMSSQELVDAYIEIQQNAPGYAQAQGDSPDLTDAEMNQVYNSAGGEAEYNRLTAWAAENIPEEKLDAFNSIIDNGQTVAIQMAVQALRSEYENQEGYEGRMLQGKAGRPTDAFRSQAEVVAAMSDPRYDRDEAYRQDVYNKLERSNVAF